MLPEKRYEGELITTGLPDGRTVVMRSEKMFVLLPSGRRDPAFGVGGEVTLVEPPGSTGSYFSSIAADSKGRIVVAGIQTLAATSDRFGVPSLLERPARVLVERLTPYGRLDPSFGEGDGILVTDFDLPPPSQEDRTDLEPIIQSRTMAVDGQDRIVITGRRTRGISCQVGKYNWPQEEWEAFAARLTASGARDGSFGVGGVVVLGPIDWIGAPTIDHSGGLYVATGITSRCRAAPGWRLLHLKEDGAFDSGFGSNGGRPTPTLTEGFNSMALDSSGRLLLSGFVPGSRSSNIPAKMVVQRFEPDGSLDRSFGRRGVASIPRTRPGRQFLAADRAGGVLIAGNLPPRRLLGTKARLWPGIMLAKLKSDGSVDERFGENGVVGIRFGRREVDLNSLALDGRVAMLGGTWLGSGKPDEGIAFARVRLSPN